jgi:hypothetical protein
VRHRLTAAILLLYPRRVREGHGPEIVSLIDDLITQEQRSRTRLFLRLAMDGLVQRIASTATAWTAVAVLAATSFGGLAVSNFAAATALHALPRTGHTVAPARHKHQTPHHLARSRRTSNRSARMIMRRPASARVPRDGHSHSMP